MTDFIERLQTEYSELGDKISSLQDFIHSDEYNLISDNQADLLIEQLEYMLKYQGVLSVRLALIRKEARKFEK
jgi:hypothetical protein